MRYICSVVTSVQRPCRAITVQHLMLPVLHVNGLAIEASPNRTTVASSPSSSMRSSASRSDSCADLGLPPLPSLPLLPPLPFPLPLPLPLPPLAGAARSAFTIDTPTLACLRAPTSLVPSPHMSTPSPRARSADTTSSFCAGATRAHTAAPDASRPTSSSARGLPTPPAHSSSRSSPAPVTHSGAPAATTCSRCASVNTTAPARSASASPVAASGHHTGGGQVAAVGWAAAPSGNPGPCPEVGSASCSCGSRSQSTSTRDDASVAPPAVVAVTAAAAEVRRADDGVGPSNIRSCDATAHAVSALSPVIMTTRCPDARSPATWAEESRFSADSSTSRPASSRSHSSSARVMRDVAAPTSTPAGSRRAASASTRDPRRVWRK
mmetsp:Transcript_10522/g.33470  ORF Transcript_10522/g.33470 Transcript_10522/m.33470 type:complete len:380 (-) Transcript_10522:94-1233(-)